MINQFIKKTVVLVILFSFIFLITGCALPSLSRFSVEEDDIEEIFRTTSVVTLNWSYGDISSIQSYKVYYRAHGDSNWIYLNTISESTSYLLEISNSVIGNGSWDFGVSAVDSSDNESEIHSCMDIAADPSTGWYLLWVK